MPGFLMHRLHNQEMVESKQSLQKLAVGHHGACLMLQRHINDFVITNQPQPILEHMEAILGAKNRHCLRTIDSRGSTLQATVTQPRRNGKVRKLRLLSATTACLSHCSTHDQDLPYHCRSWLPSGRLDARHPVLLHT